MKFALIGPGKMGTVIFHAAAGERLVVGRSPSSLEKFSAEAELGVTTSLERASQCRIVAVVLPADACGETFAALCPMMPPESILLNFSTSWDVPRELVEAFPQLHLLNAKMIGSSVGISHGLNGLVILDSTREAVTRQVQDCLPGMNIVAGDHRLVKTINTQATKAALSAAVSLERELGGQGIPKDMVRAAVGCLMPGVLIAYDSGELGAFAKKIIHELTEQPDSQG